MRNSSIKGTNFALLMNMLTDLKIIIVLFQRGKGVGRSFHKTLKCVVVNNGTHKPKKKNQINLNATLASGLTDSVDEEFKKTFP